MRGSSCCSAAECPWSRGAESPFDTDEGDPESGGFAGGSGAYRPLAVVLLSERRLTINAKGILEQHRTPVRWISSR